MGKMNKLTFLIADDHSIVRKGITQLLREEFPHAHIIEVDKGAEVFSYLDNNSCDLLLLDISMPGKSGIEILKQIRTNGSTVPILMVSMHSEDQYAIRALKAGASGFVNKQSA